MTTAKNIQLFLKTLLQQSYCLYSHSDILNPQKYHSLVKPFSHRTMKLQYLGNILYSVREKSIPELEMEAPKLTMQQASHCCFKTLYAINQCDT